MNKEDSFKRTTQLQSSASKKQFIFEDQYSIHKVRLK